MPGSISATRVHYTLGQQSIQNPDQLLTERKKEAKAEVKLFKRPQKLGTGPEWNQSTQCPNNKFPNRALMHTISTHQSINPVHNYRAEALPDTFKSTLFLPKRSKFHFDQSKLLSQREKDKVVTTNPVANSRVEFSANPAPQAAKWNDTTSITADSKKDFYVRKGHTDTLNCTKGTNAAMLQKGYIGPVQREKIRNDRIRGLKMSMRMTEMASQETNQLPFTLSNMRAGLLPDLVAELAPKEPVAIPEPKSEDDEEYEFQEATHMALEAANDVPLAA